MSCKSRKAAGIAPRQALLNFFLRASEHPRLRRERGAFHLPVSLPRLYLVGWVEDRRVCPRRQEPQED